MEKNPVYDITICGEKSCDNGEKFCMETIYASVQHTWIRRAANAADDDTVLSLAVRAAGWELRGGRGLNP